MHDMADQPKLPRLGLGTSGMDGADATEVVATALDIGYRHIDTAQYYENETAVGEGIARAEIPREELFVATKIWHTNLAHDDVLETARESLDRLGLDYVDLLYVHWPAGAYEPAETLAAFDELSDAGVADHVGVSNFTPDLLDEARTHLDAPIFAHQIECHPLLQQRTLRIYGVGHDIEPVAYSPLARGRLLDHPVLAEIGAKYDATPAQISLAWLRENGIAAIPKSSSEAHLRANYESLTLDLRSEDLDRIDALDGGDRAIDPEFAPWEGET
ncbi:aldo/keto reductase [Haladaptatus sp. ZSTT2]|uniref:aldo/keto reductase n=1 Tax=Haladaptatus sp. ZSTT2 TaxID=3120515 RepID=UPI00300F4DE4